MPPFAHEVGVQVVLGCVRQQVRPFARGVRVQVVLYSVGVNKSDLLTSSTAAQAIMHTGTADADLAITSSSESTSVAGGDVTGVATIGVSAGATVGTLVATVRAARWNRQPDRLPTTLRHKSLSKPPPRPSIG
jgi:hypothetical protein